MSRLASVPRDTAHLWLMLTLTFTTGMVDAIGFLGLDRVFTANMTGNVVILGMALVGAQDLPIAGPALALLGFMVGAALGGRMLKGSTAGWTVRVTALLIGVGVTTMGLAVVLFAGADRSQSSVSVPVATVLAIAMGAQAATARFLAVPDITTVVITSTITGLAADSLLGNGTGKRRGRRYLAVLLVLAGAAVGAVSLTLSPGTGLLLAGSLILGVTLIGALDERARDSLLADDDVGSPSGQ